MKTIEENRWMPAAFPNVQGRLIAGVRVVRKPDNATGKKPVPVFLIDTEPATREAVLKTIERFTLAGDFHLALCLWNSGAILDLHEPALSFSVDAGASLLYAENAMRKGYVHVDCRWSVTHVDVAAGMST